ncbi:MAG: winged helix-turn-helix domain-containing protein [Pyrinomonadaceae bacterium]|nr:winged helix-turn-helix domain-containing protein [Pyrinomonadaceae bacterium]
MNTSEQRIYEFEGFRLDAGKRLLSGPEGQAIALMPKAFEILLCLVQNAGSVVEKDDLMAAVWPDTIVEENNLTQNISALRKALGEKHRENRFIATVPGRGYKFVAEVREALSEESEQAYSERKETITPAAAVPSSSGRPVRFGGMVVAVIALIAAGFIYFRNAGEPGSKQISSIAVLPFKPITAERRDEALELGMADRLIYKLSGRGKISVRPLVAVRRFSSPETDPVDAGSQLGVDAVLDGGVQIADGRVRISAKLVRVKDGRQMWAGQFDENLTDIFSVQDSISDRVFQALSIPLAAQSKKSYTQNVEAYQLFTKGVFHTRRLVLPEVQQGISYLEQAIAADPGYALAYVELANAYRAMVLTNETPPLLTMPKGKAAALKAVELDPELAEAWSALAFNNFWFDFDPRTAEQNLLRSLALDPANAQARFQYAHLLSNIGRHEEALQQIKIAREADPLSTIVNALEGQILTFAGREDDALKVLRSVIDTDPNFWLAHLFIARVYLLKGMNEEAMAAAAKARELTNGNTEAAAILAYANSRAGRLEEARKILTELEERSKTRNVPAYSLATVYFALGDREKTLQLLELAFEQRESLLVFLKVEPRWQTLHSEPRFGALLQKLTLN